MTSLNQYKKKLTKIDNRIGFSLATVLASPVVGGAIAALEKTVSPQYFAAHPLKGGLILVGSVAIGFGATLAAGMTSVARGETAKTHLAEAYPAEADQHMRRDPRKPAIDVARKPATGGKMTNAR